MSEAAMRVAVLADIHGNLPALDAVLRDVEACGVDAIVLNGDLAEAAHARRDAEIAGNCRDVRPPVPQSPAWPYAGQPGPGPAQWPPAGDRNDAA
jgi:3',5'-cyclic AMP phosphodiesterase CpdA